MANKITTEVEFQAEAPVDFMYPFLARFEGPGNSNGMIVLFDSAKTGTVLKSTHPGSYVVGAHCTCWSSPKENPSTWTILPFGTKLTITQTKV